MKRLEFKEFNFLVGDHWLEKDRELIFGPLLPDDEFVELGQGATMPEILVASNVFESNTAARKNGWGERRVATFKWNERLKSCVVDQPGMFVPEGFTCFRAGKGKLSHVTIWKPSEDLQKL